MTAQFQLINKLLQTKDFSIVELNNLSDKFFFTYPNEFNYIVNHYKKYGTVPDRLTFADVFPDFDIMDINEPDSYLLEQLFNDYEESFLATTFNEVKKLVESGKSKEAFKMLEERVSTTRPNTAMTCVSIKEDTSRYDKYLDRVVNHNKYYIPTGFPELDALIGGIDTENENMVIAARTGIGKSWTLLKVAASGAQLGYNVGLYSGEMIFDKVAYRLDSLIGHISNRVITRGTDTSMQIPYKNYLDNINSYVPGDIKILTPKDINGPATVSALRTFIEKYHLDMLLIDQYSLLEDERGGKTVPEKVANISKDIKNLQVMKGIPIVSVSQLNRDKTDNGEQDTTQIGLSDRIGQDATSIIMLSRNLTYEDEAKTKVKDDKLILNVVKSRDGGSGKIIYKANFDEGRFIPLNPDEKIDPNYYSEEVCDNDGFKDDDDSGL